MKKSVINQFEKKLRREFSCWDDITIEREDRNPYSVFFITDRDRTTFYYAPLRKAMKIADAYKMIEDGGVSFLIETRTDEEGWSKPVVKIVLNITK